MYQKMIKNDVRNSKLITSTILIFIMVSAMLTSLAASLTVNLFGAIDHMLVSSKSLHFMQMHTGDVNMEALQNFVMKNDSIDDYQVSEFLNIDAADIVIGKNSLAGSIQDNGLSTQNQKFDYLLNLDGEVIDPKEGEIYVPIYYMKKGTLSLGDTVMIHGVSFQVTGFLRDSIMNAALVSSKRFLVSQADFEKVRQFGQMENLIEFRFKGTVSYPKFQSAYLDAGLPSNGPPAITFSQVKMINGITDGIMIAVLVLIGGLVIVVAFLCIRFTLLAKIEEDYKEIGVLKAIGMRVSQIKKLYLAKYGVVAGFACILGFLISLLLQGFFLQNIHLYMGKSNNSLLGILFGFLGTMIVYGFVMLYVNGVLRRIRKISASQAIRFGISQEKSKITKNVQLSKSKIVSPNIFLGVKDVLSRKKLYITMLMVLIISSFLMIIPKNISSTIASERFITYMGMGICDANIGVMRTQVPNVFEKAKEITDKVANDKTVEKYATFTGMMLERKTEEGKIEKLRVTFGNFSIFPITYAKGVAPKSESEIALSILNAEDLGKTVGDEVVLMVDGVEKHLTISGIYSDVTNGGRTAQATFDIKSGDILSVDLAIKFNNSQMVKQMISQYRKQFSFAKVTGIDETIEQMLGTIRDSIQLSSIVAIGISLLLIVLVTVLFMKLLVTKDRSSIAILKALGFHNSEIKMQYLTRSILVMILGVAIGTILANTLGEMIGIAIVSFFGAATFHFVINPWFVYIFSPLLIIGSIVVATILGISGISKLKISEYIKEN